MRHNLIFHLGIIGDPNSFRVIPLYSVQRPTLVHITLLFLLLYVSVLSPSYSKTSVCLGSPFCSSFIFQAA